MAEHGPDSQFASRIANLAAGFEQHCFCCDFEVDLKALTKLSGPLNESRGAPKGFSFCTGEIGPAMPCEGSLVNCGCRGNLLLQRESEFGFELACAACFCRSPDRCAQENEILDKELACIPQQGESVRELERSWSREEKTHREHEGDDGTSASDEREPC